MVGHRARNCRTVAEVDLGTQNQPSQNIEIQMTRPIATSALEYNPSLAPSMTPSMPTSALALERQIRLRQAGLTGLEMRQMGLTGSLSLCEPKHEKHVLGLELCSVDDNGLTNWQQPGSQCRGCGFRLPADAFVCPFPGCSSHAEVAARQWKEAAENHEKAGVWLQYREKFGTAPLDPLKHCLPHTFVEYMKMLQYDVMFLLDSGAFDHCMPLELAETLGLEVQDREMRKQVVTADGTLYKSTVL